MNAPAALKDPASIAAWMGYAPGHNGGFAVRVCAWCRDKADAEAVAIAGNLPMTHGICPRCLKIEQERQIQLQFPQP